MEETCYKCHALIPQAKVFCPECGAPLIRVVLSDPPAPEISSQHWEPPQENTHFPPRVVDSQAFQWSHAVRSIVPAGIIGSIFMFFPLGIGIAGMIASGALSAIFYYHRAAARNLTNGVGAKLGALSGIVGSLFTAVYMVAVGFFWGFQRLRELMMDQLNQYAAQAKDPRQLQMIEYFKTSQGFEVILVLGIIVMCFLFLIFSTAGGALGAAWVRRRNRS